ncbi:6421_t:CDS:2 [Ambispora gerdemannii]|uniref:6421_t:CDS:1 n=1 Tax=Ambispora gerdemannii TaxID=144530 RepID=A0A9N8ZJ70_9GLOM|nr:6421_t:CDS:2 [Ambispora gerdemannii]
MELREAKEAEGKEREIVEQADVFAAVEAGIATVSNSTTLNHVKIEKKEISDLKPLPTVATDPEQKVIGHIQFQQFPNCPVRATGIVNIFDPCSPQCEYDRVRTHYDIHVLSGFPPNKLISVVDLEDIVSANGNLDYPFQGFTALTQPFEDLGSLKCVVMLEDPNGNESNDKVLGSAQILPA